MGLAPRYSGVIFDKHYDGNKKGYNYTAEVLPQPFSGAGGSGYTTYYGIVKLFNFKDGSSGNISAEQLGSHEWSIKRLFGERDPRFKASIFYQETPFKGERVYYHSGTLVNGDTVTTGTVGSNGFRAKARSRNINNTARGIRKYCDPTLNEPRIINDADDTDYIVFRLGEIYLNLAEAAFHLGKTGKALNAINKIRERAGMPDKTKVTRKIIRHERQVELVFEGQRYWDLRRWRIAKQVWDGTRLKGLHYIYDADTREYIIKVINGEPQARTFQERNYYLPLGTQRLADDPKLVENPGY